MIDCEIQVQAMQNQVFIAMCNRVGQEDVMEFSGESLVVDPDGNILLKPDDRERQLICEIDLAEAARSRRERKYIAARRPDMYQ